MSQYLLSLLHTIRAHILLISSPANRNTFIALANMDLYGL